MRKIVVFISLSVMMVGCAIKPSQDELTNADYGSYPTNYEETIKSFMFRGLKDPSSAQYQFLNQPRTGWNGWGGTKFGYIVCAYVNAKNSFGGYTGAKLNYFMIKNGKVIYHIGGSDRYSESAAGGACKHFI